jgi:hypothetical protein
MSLNTVESSHKKGLDVNAKEFTPQSSSTEKKYFAEYPSLQSSYSNKVSSLEYQLAKSKQRMMWIERKKDQFKKDNDGQEKTIADLKYQLRVTSERADRLSQRVTCIAKEHAVVIEKMSQELDNSRSQNRLTNRRYDDLVNDYRERGVSVDNYRQENTRLRETINNIERLGTGQGNEEWIGRTLRLKYIIDEMEKVGAIRLPDHDWAIDMVKDIEIPNVSSEIKNRFLPSYQDAHMEFDGGEQEQAVIYGELSRAAAEHSEFLGDNPEEKISAVVTIQKIFRGFVQRKKIQTLYGGNIGQKVTSAIMIQKIFRGKRGRILCWVTDALNEVQKHRLKNCNRVIEGYPMNMRRINFTLINTSKTHRFCTYQWMKPDASIGRSNMFTNPSKLPIHSMKSFRGHWFRVCLFSKDPTETGRRRRYSQVSDIQKYIMIPFNIKDNSVFDVNTGVTMNRQQWENVPMRIINSEAEVQDTSVQETPTLNQCDCPRCRARRGEINSDISDDEDEANLRLAIQMSLDSMVVNQEQNISWSDDYGPDVESLFA